MEFTTIEVSAEDALGSITLNRPEKLNPLSTLTLQELAGAAAWFDEQPEVKVVVVSGAGRAFSAGADLGGFAGGGGEASVLETRQNVDWGRRMADAIEGMTAVTVARIHGHCVGGAVVLASACDLRVAAEGTRFSIPEVDLGIPLTWGGIPRLVRDIGPAMTKELVMTCRPFDAAEAKEIGFVNRVVPADRLHAEVGELVGQLLSKSAFTLAATKRQTNAVTDAMVDMPRTWNDADLFITALRDPESRAAAAAYLQRVRRT
ncbi:MAG TPA: enoyl-CoA hydratase/isomerase family protein [Acidimicrobiales bacterium]|nr:enoyl-CoA hydratase/isomerase family protein [Acidimicrobiales bacterium]